MRRLLVFAATVVFVDTVFYSALTPLLPRYSDELDLDKAQAGVLAASYAAGTFVGALPAGVLAARLGVRPTVVTGLALMAVSSVAFAFGTSVLVLDVARFLQGVGGAASWAGALGWLIGAAPVERRGELIGAALAAGIAGALFGPAVGALADQLGPRPVFASVGVIAALMIVWSLRMPPAPSEPTHLRALAVALRVPALYAGMWLVALAGLLFGTISVLLPLQMSDVGAGTSLIAAIFLVAAGFEAVVSPLSGRVADRRGRLVPVLFGVGAAAIPVALMAFSHTTWALAGLLLLVSPAIGILWAPSAALLADVAETSGIAQGLGFALVNLAWAAGQTIGSAGSARLAQAAGDALPFLLLSGMCAGSGLALARMRSRLAFDVTG
jgi:MFS family permease